MLSMVESAMRAIEADTRLDSRASVLAAMRGRMGLDDFGLVLLAMPDPRFPRVSALLPAMASEAVQDSWTGNHGPELLSQSASFVRAFAYNVARITRAGLEGATILDYGCGYGRLARLMWYFSRPDRVFGVDPWDASIAECRAAGMGDTFRLSDYMPHALPVGSTRFDAAFAFSVFTHLSKAAMARAFAAVRGVVRPGSVFAITVRPIEYWEAGARLMGYYSAEEMRAQHLRDGFAFFPFEGRLGPDGEPIYGDSSVSLEWLAANLDGWRIEGHDRSMDDPLQLYAFLVAV